MIELRLLGTLDLKGAEGRAVHSILAQPKRLALLAYLAVQTAGARRDSVVALRIGWSPGAGTLDRG